MVQASFFNDQNTTMVVMPDNTRPGTDSPVNSTQTKPGTDRLINSTEDEPDTEEDSSDRNRWVSPTDSGVTLRPNDILDCGIRYNDIGGAGDLQLTPVDVMRWTRATAAIRTIYGGDICKEAILNTFVRPDFDHTLSRGGNVDDDFERIKTGLLSLINTLTFLRSQLKLLALVCMLAAAYGGMHLIAWNSDFPSQAEELLWKVACFIVIGMIPSMLGIWCVLRGVEKCTKVSLRFIGVAEKIAKFLWVINGICRIYVTFEAFISLRSVPIGVYWTPDWLQMLPHI